MYSLDGESSNTCMEVDGVPNVRTENTLLEDGMVVKAQNVKGSADFDWMAFMDKLDWADAGWLLLQDHAQTDRPSGPLP